MKENGVCQTENLKKLTKLIADSRYSKLFSIHQRIGPYQMPVISGKLKLAIDLQNPTSGKATQKTKEFKRDNFMAGLGYKVIRFSTVQLYQNPDAVIRVIEEAVEIYKKT
jgi:very-short-patch-repair endonuclease